MSAAVARTGDIPFHPLAEHLFPPLEGRDFDALVLDIKLHGQQEPIVLLNGQILDGRNRYRACRANGLEPKFTPFRGNDPLAFVISSNLHRRHLNESQRAIVAARLATMRRGARSDLSPIGERSQEQAAEALNVGKRSVERARDVLNSGTPALVAAVVRGEIAVSQAAMLSKCAAEFQERVIAKIATDNIKPQEAFRRVKAETIEALRLEAPTGKYRVILADPAYRYDNAQQDEFREQRDHYPTMTLAEICALPVKDLAEDDAVLFLWATSPMLMAVRDVIEAWGFTYKASFVWDKVKHVMGHYNSVRHEMLLICTRGSCQPDVRALVDSVQSIERTAIHSEKPEFFYEIIEALYPFGAKLELFARGAARPGWDTWGYEALPQQAPPTAAADDDIPPFLRRAAP